MPRYVTHLSCVVNISLNTDIFITETPFVFISDPDGGCCFVRHIESVQAYTTILTSPSFIALDPPMLLLIAPVSHASQSTIPLFHRLSRSPCLRTDNYFVSTSAHFVNTRHIIHNV